ncbi:hypothetical protein K488DRAFT_45459 [Vararia minispora EC-137]|uniref:Uncharacterized protein n=1 Tax=Vararia minispora EC-137 TaxID=1314806 RepID=A0ACB8QRU6_9AGAM|nr:hypothetical protein K488DRAFT_45459 [Vararia minispora EC-137]
MGAFYIGVVVSAVLYGMSCLQTYYYYTEYPGDPIYMKALVGAVWALDTLHQALISHAVYIYLVKNFFNPLILTTVIWSVVAEVMVNGVMALLVQGFFVLRIFKLSGRNLWLSVPVAAMSLAEFGVITTYVARATPFTSYAQALQLKSLSLTVNALTAVTDVAIAAVLCFLLQKSRTGFRRRSDTLITKLIIFTVNTGLLTSIDAIVSLISYACKPNTFIYICFFFALGRLYSNSLLATLNVRRTLSGQNSQKNFESTSISLQGMNHARSTVSANMMSHHGKGTNLAIKIDTTKEFSNDVEAGEVSTHTSSCHNRPLTSQQLTVVSQKSLSHNF